MIIDCLKNEIKENDIVAFFTSVGDDENDFDNARLFIGKVYEMCDSVLWGQSISVQMLADSLTPVYKGARPWEVLVLNDETSPKMVELLRAHAKVNIPEDNYIPNID